MSKLIKPLALSLLSLCLFSCSEGNSSIEGSSSEVISTNLSIKEVSSILPGEEIQLEARKGNNYVSASFSIVNPSKTTSITSDGLFYAGSTPGTYQIKATYEDEEASINVVVDTPLIDDEAINVPTSYIVSLDLDSSLSGVAASSVSLEVIKGKGFYVSLGDGGVYIEDGVCYNYLVEDNKATFSYEDDVSSDASVESVNATFDLKSAINSNRYEYFSYYKSKNEFLFQMTSDAISDTVAEYDLFFFMGLFNLGIGGALVGVSPVDGSLSSLYGTDGSKLYNLNLTSIEDFSISPIIGMHTTSSDSSSQA